MFNKGNSINCFWPLALCAIRAQGKIYRHAGGLKKNFNALHESHTKPQRTRPGKPYCSVGLLGETTSLPLRSPPYINVCQTAQRLKSIIRGAHKFNYFVFTFALTVSVQALAANEGGDNQEKLRDPTMPLAYKVVSTTQKSLVLQAVFRSTERVTAIVNGKTVVAGSVVDDATIVAVHDKSVTYRRNGQTRVVQLRPSIVKKMRK